MAELLIKRGDNTHIDTEKDKGCYKEGDIVIAKSDLEIELTWAQMLICGTHDREIPFHTTLYSKYFDRVKVQNKSRQKVTATTNFRIANENAPKGVRYVDKEKIKISKPISNEVKQDIQTYFGELNVKHPLADKSLLETWPWGIIEEKQFFTLTIPDNEFADENEIQQLIEGETDKDGKTTICRKRKIDFRNKLTDLQLSQTFQQADLSLIVPNKAKQYFTNNLIGKGMTENSTMLDWLDSDMAMPNRHWLTFSKDLIELKSVIK